MAFELYVWGPAFGLPSINPECIATIAFCHTVIPAGQWSLVTSFDQSIGIQDALPILFDEGIATATGFEDVISYLRNHPAVTKDPDSRLTKRQRTDRVAYISFLETTAIPLIDLLLYVSAENYNTATSAAYTAILPWYANYTVPPNRREQARKRTAHLGLSGLDVDASAEEGFAPGRGTAASEYENAKRAAGIPVENKSRTPSMGRGRGIGGLFGNPVQAARFKLDALSGDLVEPLSDLLGDGDYLFGGHSPSSLDCLAFGYLALLFNPNVPQAWMKDIIETKHPRIVQYIRRMRQTLFEDEDFNATEVWANKSGHAMKSALPWQAPAQTTSSKVVAAVREVFGNLPLISLISTRPKILHGSQKLSRTVPSALPSPAFVNTLLSSIAIGAVALASFAVHHRRNPRDGPLIFWALRPMTEFGGVGSIQSVLSQLPSGGFSQF